MSDISSILIALVPVAMVAVSAVNLIKHGATILLSPKKSVSSIQISWIVYLLFTHVTFLWGIIPVAENTNWNFLKFGLFATGPALLILSSALIGRVGGNSSSPEDRYMAISQQFLPTYALLRLWQLIAQGVLKNYSTITISVVLTLVVVAILRFNSSYRWHISGAIAVWLIFVYTIVMQSL